MVKPRKSADGYLFPIPHHLIERIFSGGKNVFVKASNYRLLTEGSTIVFYDSGSHAVIGEAKIKKIVRGDPQTIWNEFAYNLFLQHEEFNSYVLQSPLGPRKKRITLSAFVLEKIHRYPKPAKPQKRVTPAGYYVPTSAS